MNVRDADLEGQLMAMWRIRINLADDPRSRARLNEVLARSRLVLSASPRAPGPRLSCPATWYSSCRGMTS